VAVGDGGGLLLAGLVLPAGAASLEGQLKTLWAEIRKDVGGRLPPIPVPSNNPQTRDKVKLGEAPFFDPNLDYVAKYVKLYGEALAPIPCGRMVPQSCLGDSLSPKLDGPCLLRRESAGSASGQSGAFRDIT